VTPADLYLSQHEVIESAIRFVCRHYRLPAADADEFAGIVRVKLIENDYDILRRFQQRSSLRTFLVAVVQRTYLDYRNRVWGRWRPSVEAKRLGVVAVELERLLVRDGFTFDQAVEYLTTNRRVQATAEELDAIRQRLPVRMPRQFVGEEVLENVPGDDGRTVDHALDRLAREPIVRSVQHALERAIDELDETDRLLVKLRFYDGITVADIARMLRVDQKPLYRRLTRTLGVLRASLRKAGVEHEAADILRDAGIG
jgi:RNA polymerase sigma factor (sigma-70 family)